MANNKKQIKNAYDEVPYQSFPFLQTDPSRQKAIAYLFGFKTADLNKAKILEIGCASGNNILSIAAKYPHSECLGIDSSAKQIEEGNKVINALGIKNLKLEKKSILDFKSGGKKFDFIICHGVFSWVSKLVQNKILEICSSSLNTNGIAYISYNTLPGWNSVISLREMMLYHTHHFESANEKAAQARMLLQFILESSKARNKNFYSDIIENELAILENQSDWYLLHDHLEENNIPYYFYQFMDKADKYNLQYLSDTDLASMYIGNLPEEASKILETSNDIIRSEQYIDFITNRRFRTTLLCNKNAKLERNINIALITDKYFTTSYKAEEDIGEYRYAHGKTVNFIAPNNIRFSTSDPEIIAAISILIKQKQNPISLDALCSKVIEILNQQAVPVKDIPDLKDYLALHFLRNIFTGGVILHLDPAQHTNNVSNKPEAYYLSIYQSKKQEWVTSLLHDYVHITEFDKAFLPLLDGRTDISSITNILYEKFKKNNLSMYLDNNKIEDDSIIKDKLPEVVDNILKRYADLGLLTK